MVTVEGGNNEYGNAREVGGPAQKLNVWHKPAAQSHTCVRGVQPLQRREKPGKGFVSDDCAEGSEGSGVQQAGTAGTLSLLRNISKNLAEITALPGSLEQDLELCGATVGQKDPERRTTYVRVPGKAPPAWTCQPGARSTVPKPSLCPPCHP